jgi:hypothetical protein
LNQILLGVETAAKKSKDYWQKFKADDGGAEAEGKD